MTPEATAEHRARETERKIKGRESGDLFHSSTRVFIYKDEKEEVRVI